VFDFRQNQEVYPLHVVQTGSGVHLTSYPMGSGDYFRVVKRPDSEADHSSQTSDGVRTFTSKYFSMA
jgi:hypothetical protein